CCLARKINIIFRVDLKLLGDLRREFTKAWPDLCEIRYRHVWVRQQLERRTTLPVSVERKSVTLRLFRRDRNRFRKFSRVVHRCHFSSMQSGAFCTDATDRNSSISQTLIGIVCTQLQTILGARGKHTIGFADTARDEVIDHHAKVSLRTIDDDSAALTR